MDSLSPRDFIPQELPFTFIQHVTPQCACSGKQCIKCEHTTCIAGFFHDKRRVKASSVCLTCYYAYHRSYGHAHHEEHKDDEKIWHQTYYQKHKEQIKLRQQARPEVSREANRRSYRKHREKTLRRLKAYAMSNPEKIRAKGRKRYLLNPESFKVNWNRYAQVHPERLIAKHAKRRTLKSQAGGSFTEQEWQNLFRFYNFTCLCCGRREPEIKLHADHVIPIIKHGTSFIENIQPLCGSCNSSKHVKIIDYRIKWEA